MAERQVAKAVSECSMKKGAMVAPLQCEGMLAGASYLGTNFDTTPRRSTA